MKYLKIFEDYTIQKPYCNSFIIYPDFFTEGELFDYFNLVGEADWCDLPKTDTIEYYEYSIKFDKKGIN